MTWGDQLCNLWAVCNPLEITKALKLICDCQSKKKSQGFSKIGYSLFCDSKTKLSVSLNIDGLFYPISSIIS